MTKKVCITLMAMFAVLLTACGGNNQDVQPQETVAKVETKAEPLIDATQFAGITPDELKKIMGEPMEVEQWNFLGSNDKKYPTTTYYYDLGEEDGNYEFMIIDGAVVRFTVNFHYYDNKGLVIDKDANLFDLLGIETEDGMKRIADTGVALRYRSVGDSVADFWVTYGESKEAVDVIKVTYNLSYFD